MLIKFSTPAMGKASAITIGSPNLDQSLAYYQLLGFKETFRTDFPFPLLLVTDGVLLIMLREKKKPYFALTYFAEDPEVIVKKLEVSGIRPIEVPQKDALVKRYLFQSPDGLNVSVVTYANYFEQPRGKTMLLMPPSHYSKPEKYTNKACGMFGELAQPVNNLKDSIKFWEKLGFISISSFESPYPWAIVSDGLSIIGLHQSPRFSGPAITFYAADMADKIQKLKKNGLTSYTPATAKENLVLKTPEGQYINLFQLGTPVKMKK